MNKINWDCFTSTQELFKDIPEKERPDKALELLHVAIRAHQEALELLQQVNRIGNEHYFVIVFSAGLSLGFALFQLVSVSNIPYNGAIRYSRYLDCLDSIVLRPYILTQKV